MTPGASGEVFVGEPSCCLGQEAGERLRGAARPGLLGGCLIGCAPNDAPLTWRSGLTLVRAALGPRLVSRRGWQWYSTEVQQLTRTRADLRGRGRTVTCTDGRGWTCCRQMACKRSAVRARLAPPGGLHVSVETMFTFGSDILRPGRMAPS